MSVTGANPGSTLRRISSQLRPGAGGFLAWWGRSLGELLPLRLRRALELEAGRVLVQAGAGTATDGARLWLQRGGEMTALAPVDLAPVELAGDRDPLAGVLPPRQADLPRWLLLPPDAVLRRTLRLPAAAAERLREVATFEIERQTPFTADAVHHDARVLGPAGEGQVDAELVVVPRARLQPRLDALGGLQARLAGVDVAGADGVPLGINLLPPGRRHRPRDRWAGVNLALGGIALLALAALAWQLLDNRRDAADALEQDLAARAEAGRRQALERSTALALLQGQAFLEQTRRERPTATEVLAELTRRLPDDTYLEKLSMEGDQLMLIGLGTDAAGLVRTMQDAGPWRSPALAGALMPDAASGRDRFTLTARLAPAPAAAADGDDAPVPSTGTADDAAG